MKVLFYVQHLLGIGHLTRAATLARAMNARGMSVTLVSGGMPLELLDRTGFDLVQLPPVRAADARFSGLVGEDGRPLDEGVRERRRAQLLDVLSRVRPDAVMIELFPFGRRQLADEIVALIEAARSRSSRPRIVCSVRDILVEKTRPDVDAQTVANARRWFDAVLVHGDPAVIAFDATFSRAREIADLVRYTGYVVEEDRKAGGADGQGEVIVSAGSSATGEALLRTAIAARPLSPLADAPWRLLAGPSLPEDVFASLRREAPRGVTVERARSDFRVLLARAALSLSQGGYNTVMETLAAGTRSVVVPFAEGRETEQTVRARLLAERRLLIHLSQAELAPERLARAVGDALALPPPQPAFDRDGARKTAEFLARMMAPAR